MKTEQVRHAFFAVAALGMLGLTSLLSGCGGASGESNVAPLMPEGISPGQAQIEARKQAYGVLGDPRPTRRSPNSKTH